MTEFQNKALSLIMGCLLIASMFVVGREVARSVAGGEVVKTQERCVVIDAGHGGGK